MRRKCCCRWSSFLFSLSIFSQVTENIISKQTFIGEYLSHTHTHTHTHVNTHSRGHTIIIPDIFPPCFLSPSEARTMPRTFNNSGSKFMTSVTQRPSAHLTLRDTSSQGETPVCPSGEGWEYYFQDGKKKNEILHFVCLGEVSTHATHIYRVQKPEIKIIREPRMNRFPSSWMMERAGGKRMCRLADDKSRLRGDGTYRWTRKPPAWKGSTTIEVTDSLKFVFL